MMMKITRILVITTALILLGMVIMIPTEEILYKLMISFVLIIVAIGWYSAKDLRI